MKLSNLSLRVKLGASFFAVVVMTAAVGTFAVSQLSRINDNTEELATDWIASIEAINVIRSAANENRRAEAQHALAVDAEDMKRQEQRLLSNKAKLADALQRYEPLISSPEEKQLAETLKQEISVYLAASSRLVALSSNPAKVAETRDYFGGESRSALNAVIATGDELAELNSNGAKAAHASASATFVSARAWLISLVAAAVGIASLLAWWIINLIIRPIAQAVDAANRIAGGDLTVEFDVDGRDEVARMLEALAAMQRNLSDIVSHVRENAEGVATASAQIAQGNNDLSGRTEEQASALEETAASMEQLSSTVKQNADNARQANQLAQGASSVAVRGGDAVREVVKTMKDINASSKRITDIISVIDGIAFQTNILALNAAVEAARAGEQGRGFAVVATEVRGLAHRSAEAAKEIKGLISSSVEGVEKGTALVDQAGVTMQEVVASIRRVTDLMGEISVASNEQSAGVAQVGEAVMLMDQATQQNAALVEESAAAAESLKVQATQLVKAVCVFTIGSARADAERSADVKTKASPLAVTSFRSAPTKPLVQVRRPATQPSAMSINNNDPYGARSEALSTGTDGWESF